MNRELGRFETAATLSNQHATFVVVIALHLENGPSSERLAAALAGLQQRHPLLGVRVVERNRKFWFESEGTPAIPLRVVEREGDESWIDVVEEELNAPFDAATGPLLHCTHVASSTPGVPEPVGPRSEIVLTFHHAAMDAVSGYRLLAELLHRCAATSELYEGPPDDQGDSGLPPVEQRFPPAWRGARGRVRLAGFAARQLADEVGFRLRTRGARRPPIPSSPICRVLPLALSEEATSALARAARRRRVTVNGVLSACFLLSVSRRLYQSRAAAMRYISIADLRPHVAPRVPAHALGAYIAMLRYTARLRPGTGLWELAHEVSRQVAGGVRRGDMFGATLMSPWVMRTLFRRGSERMAATAVSYSGVDRLDRRYGSIGLRGLNAFVANFGLGPEYTAMARLFNSALQLDAVYLDGDMDRALARAIADDILETLNRAAEED